MRRGALVGALLTIAGSMAVEPVRAQCPIDHRPGHIGHGSYSPWKYWTPRVYPVVACCRGVNRFEQPPGAAYRVCLKKYHNPDFIGYDGAYSGYDRAPQVLPTPTASPPAPAGNSENAPAPRSY